MKKMMLLGAAALIGLAFAPNAAAGGWSQFDNCQINESPPPIGDEGVFALCLLSKYEQNWGSTSYTQSYPVFVYLYSLDHDLQGHRLYLNDATGIQQYSYKDPWSEQDGTWIGTSTYAYLLKGWNTVAQGGAFASFNQYQSTGGWQSEQTSVNAGTQLYAQNSYNYIQVYYYQYSYGGSGCTEAAYLSYSVDGDWGSEQLIAPQPCSFEFEQTPQL